MDTKIIDVPSARVPELLPLASEFYNAGFLPGYLNPEHFCSHLSRCLFEGKAILLGAEMGGNIIGSIGGYIQPDPRSGELVATETHWFVANEHRKSDIGMRLKRAFEMEALRKHAVGVSMVHLCNTVGEKLANMYQHDGYRPVEIHYYKELVLPEVQVQVMDDFFEDPLTERSLALSREFKTVEYQGMPYKGVAEADEMKERVVELVKSKSGIDIQIELSFFRMGRTNADEPTTYIHADNGVPANYAGVVYLNENNEPGHGTAFWRHRELGWERTPRLITEVLADRLNREGAVESNWDRTRLAEAEFNRLVVYPSDAFHSRYPKQGFGSNEQEARLVYVFFFNILEK